MYPESAHTASIVHAVAGTPPTYGEPPNRPLTAFEVAEFVGCHEETVRRAYRLGLLVWQRFGIRSRRFHPRDVLERLARGAPNRHSTSG